MKKILLTAAGFMLALGMSQPAHAATFLYTSCHVTGGCGDFIDVGFGLGYGQVDLVANANGSVTVTSTLYDAYFYVATGAGDEQYFQFNGTNVAIGDITPSTTDLKANAGPFTHAGSTFAFGIGPGATYSCPNPGTCAYTSSITFTVAGATITDLSTPNAAGERFVADVSFPAATTGGARRTGLIDVSGSAVSVPDGGSTMMLLGSALLGIGVLRRKFARN
jgi:hypothetical protein